MSWWPFGKRDAALDDLRMQREAATEAALIALKDETAVRRAVKEAHRKRLDSMIDDISPWGRG